MGKNKKYDQKECGTRIKELRIERKLSQKSMAEALNIGIDHYRSIEIGRRGASIEILIDLSDLFNVSLDYLIRGRMTQREKLRAAINKIIKDLEDLRESI